MVNGNRVAAEIRGDELASVYSAEEREAIQSEVAAEIERRRPGLRPTAPPPERRRHFDRHDLSFDDEGNLWVRTYETRDGRTIFRVFDRELRMITEVLGPGAVEQFSIRGDLLVATVVGPLGVKEVHLSRISAAQ